MSPFPIFFLVHFCVNCWRSAMLQVRIRCFPFDFVLSASYFFLKYFSCITLCYFSVTFKCKVSPSQILDNHFCYCLGALNPFSLLWVIARFLNLSSLSDSSSVTQSWPVGVPHPSSHCDKFRNKLATKSRPLWDIYKKHKQKLHHTVVEEKPNFLLGMWEDTD